MLTIDVIDVIEVLPSDDASPPPQSSLESIIRNAYRIINDISHSLLAYYGANTFSIAVAWDGCTSVNPTKSPR